jgi:hypothetical protein
MKRGIRALTILSVTGLATACAAIVGIGDVPDSLDGGPDGSPSTTRQDSSGDQTVDTGVPDGDRDGTPFGGSDGSSEADMTAASESGADSAHVEAGSMEAGPMEAAPGPGIDAAACSFQWNGFDLRCNACGQAQCCAELALCETPDQAGLNDKGVSFCSGLVTCITGYEKSSVPMQGDMLCPNDDNYLPSEVQNAEAALTCIRSKCSSQCVGL